MNTSLEGLLESARLGMQSGDLEYFGYGLQVCTLNKLYSTPPLSEVVEEAHRHHRDLAKHYGSGMPYYIIKIWSQLAENLAGHAPLDADMRGSFFEPDELLPMFERTGYATAIVGYDICHATLLSFLGEHEKALGRLERAYKEQEAVMCLVLMPALYYHYSLSMTALYDRASRSGKRKYVRRIRRNQKQLLKWRNAAPMNQSQRYALVQAELARILGKHSRAMKLYAEAIALAREHGYTQDEALANERAGAFYEGLGQERAARGHLREAYSLYEKWGAEAKLRRLRLEHEFLNRGLRVVGGQNSENTAGKGAHPNNGGSGPDMRLVLESARAISGELRLEGLLERFMTAVIGNANATRGVLFLELDGELRAAARKTAESETLLCDSPLDECADVPRLLIRDAMSESRDPAAGDALHDERPAEDAYISRTRPRSIVCMPLTKGGRVVGLLYLENELVPGAFTAERLEIARILTDQASVSLENARSYAGLEDKVKELNVASTVSRDDAGKAGAFAPEERVKELAQQIGKRVRLEIDGVMDDPELDMKLRESLRHMLDNAVLHGIETPDERRRAGKPEQGIIKLTFAQRDGELHVTCEDDGAGLNGARIRSKALRKNLISAEQAKSLGETDLHRLLFTWGFSTMERRPDFSGRGVGLAIVREDVRALGGRIIMKSRPGTYTRITMELPLHPGRD